MKDFLKDDQFYIDRYDLETIKECLRYIEYFRESYVEFKDDQKLNHLTPEQIKHEFNKALSMVLYTLRGERYKQKSETIEEWKAKDQARQDKYDNTPVPKNIHCSCGKKMNLDFKYLEERFNRPKRMLFTLRCPGCDKHKGIYDNGDPHIVKPALCPKCGTELKVTSKFKGDDCRVDHKCPSCKYIKTDSWNVKEDQEAKEKKEASERELLAKYRDELCFNEKDGGYYIGWIANLKAIMDKCREKEELKNEYDAITKMKKLKIGEVEKLIGESAGKSNYSKFELSKPEIDKCIVVEFNIQDDQSNRSDRESRLELQKIMKEALAGTNWRLVESSISCRLGYLSGRLKGYDSEQDLLRLVSTKKQSKKASEGLLDDE